MWVFRKHIQEDDSLALAATSAMRLFIGFDGTPGIDGHLTRMDLPRRPKSQLTQKNLPNEEGADGRSELAVDVE